MVLPVGLAGWDRSRQAGHHPPVRGQFRTAPRAALPRPRFQCRVSSVSAAPGTVPLRSSERIAHNGASTSTRRRQHQPGRSSCGARRRRLSRIVLATAAGLACWPAGRSARRPLRQQPRARAPCPRIPRHRGPLPRATTRYAGPPAIRTRTWRARLAPAHDHPGRHGDSVRFIPLTEKIRPVIGGGTYVCGPWPVTLICQRHSIRQIPPAARRQVPRGLHDR